MWALDRVYAFFQLSIDRTAFTFCPPANFLLPTRGLVCPCHQEMRHEICALLQEAFSKPVRAINWGLKYQDLNIDNTVKRDSIKYEWYGIAGQMVVVHRKGFTEHINPLVSRAPLANLALGRKVLLQKRTKRRRRWRWWSDYENAQEAWSSSP